MDDEERWWKLFRLLGSDNDAEAMAALRMMRSALRKSGSSWTQYAQLVEKRMRAAELVAGGLSYEDFVTMLKKAMNHER